jgi:hypothetical protein
VIKPRFFKQTNFQNMNRGQGLWCLIGARLVVFSAATVNNISLRILFITIYKSVEEQSCIQTSNIL